MNKILVILVSLLFALVQSRQTCSCDDLYTRDRLVFEKNAQSSYCKVDPVPQIQCTGVQCGEVRKVICIRVNDASDVRQPFTSIKWKCVTNPLQDRLGIEILINDDSVKVGCESCPGKRNLAVEGSCGVSFRLLDPVRPKPIIHKHQPQHQFIPDHVMHKESKTIHDPISENDAKYYAVAIPLIFFIIVICLVILCVISKKKRIFHQTEHDRAYRDQQICPVCHKLAQCRYADIHNFHHDLAYNTSTKCEVCGIYPTLSFALRHREGEKVVNNVTFVQNNPPNANTNHVVTDNVNFNNNNTYGNEDVSYFPHQLFSDSTNTANTSKGVVLHNESNTSGREKSIESNTLGRGEQSVESNTSGREKSIESNTSGREISSGWNTTSRITNTSGRGESLKSNTSGRGSESTVHMNVNVNVKPTKSSWGKLFKSSSSGKSSSNTSGRG